MEEQQAFQIDQDLSNTILSMEPDQLLAFRELHRENWNEAHIEVDIFILLVLGSKLRDQEQSRASLDEAVQEAESWAADKTAHPTEQGRRLRILDNVMAVQLQLNQRQPITSTRVLDRITFRPDLLPRLTSLLDAPPGQLELDENLLVSTVDEFVRCLNLMAQDDPRRARLSSSLCSSLLLLHNKSPTDENLDRLLGVVRQAIDTVPPNHSARPMVLTTFAHAMFFNWRRHSRGDIESSMSSRAGTDQEYLDDAIAALEKALVFLEEGRRRETLALQLGEALSARFLQSGQPHDFKRGMEICEQFLHSRLPSDSTYHEAFQLKSEFLVAMATKTRTLEDLDANVEHFESGLRYFVGPISDRLRLMCHLAMSCELRYQETGIKADIDRAVSLSEETLAWTDIDDERLSQHIGLLVTHLLTRASGLRTMKDVDEAVVWADLAFVAPETTIDDAANRRRRLGTALQARFVHTNSIEDLDQAIAQYQDALRFPGCSEYTLAKLKSALSRALSTRALYTNSKEDLDLASHLSRETATKGPLANDVKYILDLGLRCYRLYQRNNRLEDLDEAIAHFERARDMATGEIPIAQSLFQLGECWRSRHMHSGSREELEVAIGYHEMAVNMAMEGRPECGPYRVALAESHYRLYLITEDLELLNQAISVVDEVLSPESVEAPINRSQFLQIVLKMRWKRYQRERREEDRASCIEYCRELRNDISAPALRRLLALGGIIERLYAPENLWDEALDMLRHCVEDLLPLISPLSLQSSDKQYMLEQCPYLASDAAAAALNCNKSPQEALQLLELGRGLISGVLLEIRSDVSLLQLQHPDLAARLDTIRTGLDTTGLTEAAVPTENPQPSESALSRIASARRSQELLESYVRICDEIREKEGFEGFLLPPTPEEMKAAAREGTFVVVNVSRWRCDAFIITEQDIRVLPLPRLSFALLYQLQQSGNRSRIMDKAMEFLWDTVAHPVLNALGIDTSPTEQDSQWKRIWWIPTGPLVTFPIHAAGYHEASGTSGRGRSVLDRVVSSYASSIKSVIYSRKQNPRPPPAADSHGPREQALVIPMPHTPHRPGEPPISALPFAEDEARKVQRLMRSGLHLDAVMPARRKRECLGFMKSCRIFHFAGHGTTDPADPSRSAILLEDWLTDQLTVSNVRDNRIQETGAFLAYLSACSTGTTQNAKLLDESIHLVSGFQLAGFRHVIGTLWEVADAYCVDVATNFYSELIREGGLTDRGVSLALHRAVKRLRDWHWAAGTGGSPGVRDTIGEANWNSSLDNAVEEEEAAPVGFNQGAAIDRSTRTARYEGDDAASYLNAIYWAPYVHFGV